jgi:hypothetical protein
MPNWLLVIPRIFFYCILYNKLTSENVIERGRASEELPEHILRVSEPEAPVESAKVVIMVVVILSLGSVSTPLSAVFVASLATVVINASFLFCKNTNTK